MPIAECCFIALTIYRIVPNSSQLKTIYVLNVNIFVILPVNLHILRQFGRYERTKIKRKQTFAMLISAKSIYGILCAFWALKLHGFGNIWIFG